MMIVLMMHGKIMLKETCAQIPNALYILFFQIDTAFIPRSEVHFIFLTPFKFFRLMPR
jgi:hypothetical protein